MVRASTHQRVGSPDGCISPCATPVGITAVLRCTPGRNRRPARESAHRRWLLVLGCAGPADLRGIELRRWRDPDGCHSPVIRARQCCCTGRTATRAWLVRGNRLHPSGLPARRAPGGDGRSGRTGSLRDGDSVWNPGGARRAHRPERPQRVLVVPGLRNHRGVGGGAAQLDRTADRQRCRRSRDRHQHDRGDRLRVRRHGVLRAST